MPKDLSASFFFILFMVKPWYKSNTKRGAFLVGVGAIVGTIGLIDQGELALSVGLPLILGELGGILTIVGLRNAISPN
jgi:hypothetical protein